MAAAGTLESGELRLESTVVRLPCVLSGALGKQSDLLASVSRSVRGGVTAGLCGGGGRAAEGRPEFLLRGTGASSPL